MFIAEVTVAIGSCTSCWA